MHRGSGGGIGGSLTRKTAAVVARDGWKRERLGNGGDVHTYYRQEICGGAHCTHGTPRPGRGRVT